VSKLGEPAPEGAALERMLRAALRAPDHGLLRPWKVLLVRGPARQRLGEVLAASLKRRHPQASDEDLERERRKPLRAPLLAIVVASIRNDTQIPEIEQMMSAGCVAYGLQIAAQAEGFGAIWRTGEAAYDRAVHEALGLGMNDRIVGILYVGTPLQKPPEVPRPALEDHVLEWTGEEGSAPGSSR
jgi:nitroreductase